MDSQEKGKRSSRTFSRLASRLKPKLPSRASSPAVDEGAAAVTPPTAATAVDENPRPQSHGDDQKPENSKGADEIKPDKGIWAQALEELRKEDEPAWNRLKPFFPDDEVPSAKRVDDAIQRLKTAVEEDESSKSAKISRWATKTIDVVLKFSSTISAAAALEPHVSIAWSAASTLLPDEDAAKGIQTVIYLLRALEVKRSIDNSSSWSEERICSLEASKMSICRQILGYESALLQYREISNHKRLYGQVTDNWGWTKKTEGLELAYAQYTDLWESNIRLETHTELRQQHLERQKQLDDKYVENILLMLDTKYLDIKEKKPSSKRRIQGTGQWFFAHPAYAAWLGSKQSELLWITAAPGCGKSMLCQYLIDARESLLFPKDGPKPFFCFYIFSNEFSAENDSTFCMKAILQQLLFQDNALHIHYKEAFRGREPGNIDFGTLWVLFLNVISNPLCNRRGIVCVIDGLDECQPGPRKSLIQKLTEIFDQNINSQRTNNTFLKIIITSRPYGEIEEGFAKITKPLESIRLDLADDDLTITLDINRYIDERVREAGSFSSMSSKWQNEMAKALKQQENRTYLYVQLVLEENWKTLCGVPPHSESLQNFLPSNIQEMYEKILERSFNSEDARSLLHIILAAREPLRVSDALVALIASKENEETKSSLLLGERIPQEENACIRYIKDLCGLMLSIVDGKVLFLHQTARDFLVWRYERTGLKSMSLDDEWRILSEK